MSKRDKVVVSSLHILGRYHKLQGSSFLETCLFVVPVEVPGVIFKGWLVEFGSSKLLSYPDAWT